ncbi:MAG: antitoxin VapB family protein [Candidatus Bathyarchaeia archaeon]|jgi:predicted CopG family antitoxin
MFSGKTITVTQEAYNALIRERKGNETLSDTILRLIKNNKPKNNFRQQRMVPPEGVRNNFDNGWYNNSDLL